MNIVKSCVVVAWIGVAWIVSAGEMKLMSFNIRHGEGMDGKIDLARAAAAIDRERPDFVGVQEVDWRVTRTGKADQPAELARLTGMRATFSKAIFLQGGQYGVMLLSREAPIGKVEVPLPGMEPRVLLLCEFADCVVGTTHLSVAAESERVESLALIRQAVGKFAGKKPVFLTGDWNSRPDSAVVKGVGEFAKIISKMDCQTFHGRSVRDAATCCLDYIAVDATSASRFTVSDARVVEECMASDHAPVVATVTVDDVRQPEPALVPAPVSVKMSAGCRRVQATEVGAALVTQRTTDASIPAEGYRLTISGDGIAVASSDEAGFFYALQTLRQLAKPAWGRLAFPCCEIDDAPRFGWRGVHLDDSRHFFGKAAVKRTLDLMAQHKLNVFHWHLTDNQGFRMPVTKHPKLTTVGATREFSKNQKTLADWFEDGIYGPFSYSETDIRDVVTYARERHIRIVPEIDVPGHSAAALLAYPEMACFPDGAGAPEGAVKNVLCLGRDETVAFVRDVFDEVVRLFPESEIIHIGGDEVNKVNWKACPRCQARMKAHGLKTENELQAWFMCELTDYLAKKGRRVVGWDEIILDGQAPKGAVVMSWRGAEGGIAAAKAGLDSVMCPHVDCYFDYSQQLADDPATYPWFTVNLPLARAYAYDPLAGIPAEMRGHVLGGQCCNWSEYTCNETELQWKMWPRTCATAEVFWSPAAARDFSDFSRRMTVHRRRLVAQHVNCAPLN